MPSTGASALVVALTALALVVFIREIRYVLLRHGWLTPATLGFLLVAASTSLVDITITATGQWTHSRDAFGESVISPPDWAYQLQLVLYLALLIGSLVLFAMRVTARDALLNIPAVLFLVLSLLSGASALLRGDNPVRWFYVVFVGVLVATTVAPRGFSVHLGFAAFLTTSAIACGVLVVARPEFATFACAPDKCGLLNFSTRGFLDNENALAMYLSLAMPFVYLAFRRYAGTILSGYILFLVLLTGSRSGAIAGLVTFALLVVVRPDIRRPSFTWPRAVVLYGSVAAAFLVGVALPWTTDDPDAYTGRAYLWTLARGLLFEKDSLLFGRGARGWEDVRQTGQIDFSAVYSVHNEWLQILFSTGLVGVLLVVVALGVLIAQAGRRHALVVGCVLVPVVCLATTERPWPIDIVDWLVWSLPGALLCYPVRPGPSERRAVPPDAADEGSSSPARPATPSAADDRSPGLEEAVS